MDLVTSATQILVFIAAPLVIGLLLGVDRKLTARMQNRIGPPLLQPFIDMAKLFYKRPLVVNDLQIVFAGAALLFQAIALALFVVGGDILVALFISSAGSVWLVLGAFSAASPYSYVGGQRELLAILAYEPILFVVVIAIGLESTFLVKDINEGLLTILPLAVVAMIPVLVILLEKSPFDVPTAHQEIMAGPYVEYSGPYLAMMELARWFQLAFVFGIMTLFVWDQSTAISVAAKVAIVLLSLFAVIVIDNSTARLTRGGMVKFTLGFGLGLMALNLIVLFVVRQGVI
jgi:ech hydrogenase subunit B